MDLQDSVQRSLQNPAEKILQICTDSQRSKTWVMKLLRNVATRVHVNQDGFLLISSLNRIQDRLYIHSF